MQKRGYLTFCTEAYFLFIALAAALHAFSVLSAATLPLQEALPLPARTSFLPAILCGFFVAVAFLQ
jgi:hypothetical protein